MSNAQKNKGKGFERDIAKIFTNVFKHEFKRVPNSGAIIGGKNFKLIEKLSQSQILLFRGDIIPPDELKNIVIECKARKNFIFHHLFTDNKDINKWIDQLMVDVNKCEEKEQLLPLLIFKIDRKGMFICFREKNKNLLKKNVSYFKYFKENIVWYIQEFNKEWLEYNKEKIEVL